MQTKHQRRLIMLVLLLGGPVGGWLLNGDRGLLFGLIVSLFAVVWFVIEERKLL
jgi:hypothetical protein